MSDEICTYIALALSLMVVILKVVGLKKHLFNGNKDENTVLKEIREMTFLGLKEVKDIIQSTPYVIKENISNSEARNIKNILERTGAEVVIR